MNSKVIIALSTCPDPTVGRALAREMVESGRAACVNLVPGIESVYRWQGQIHADEECLLVVKTTETAFPELRDWLQRRHPYELPEIVAVPVTDGLPAYLAWVAGAVTGESPDK